MNIIELKERQNISDDIKLKAAYLQLGELLKELEKKELTHKVIESVNHEIEELNSTSFTNNEFIKSVKEKQAKIIRIVETELKIVPRNYYRNLWVAVGMSAFGLPIGVAIGLSAGNIGLLAMGLPVGIIIGFALGSGMDKKAFEEGRQLNIEIK